MAWHIKDHIIVLYTLYYMTVEQMVVATNSSRAWLYNARRLLGRRLHRTPSGARWWGLVRMLNFDVGLPLKAASRVADAVFGRGFQSNRLRVSASADGAAALQLDLERFHSTANARLAAAFAFALPRTRGRPPRTRRTPASSVALPLRVRVESEPAKLDRLVAWLRQVDARPRGIERGLPFILDATTLRAVVRLALTTRDGDVDVLVVAPPRAEARAPGDPSRGR